MKGFIFAVLLSIIVVILANQSVFAGVESLVLYLPFDEGSGDSVKDMSGKGNNGKILGAKWVDGKTGKALEFDGKSYVEIPHSESLSLEKDITVMAWVFMSKVASGELAIVSKGQWAAMTSLMNSPLLPEALFSGSFTIMEGGTSVLHLLLLSGHGTI